MFKQEEDGKCLSECFPPCFLRQDLSLNCELVDLASQSPSTSITVVSTSPGFSFFNVGTELKLRFSGLFTNGAISQVPTTQFNLTDYY